MVAEADITVQDLHLDELRAQLERCEARIQQGSASGQDYQAFIACQLELLERQQLQR